MANRLDTSKLGGGGEGGKQAGAPEAGAAGVAAGGISGWLPLIVMVITMPLLAYVTTNYLLIPKVQQSLRAAGVGLPAGGEGAAGGGEEGSGSRPVSVKPEDQVKVPINKMLVNVSGTLGTRYLLTSVTLVGATAGFPAMVDKNKDQLIDLATSTLSTKTITDLEKPGARNQIRTELMSLFNNALGGSYVQELYITELAIQ